MPVIGQGVEICTSTTRPTNPVVGTVIYETDTASYRWCTAVSPSITWLGMTPTGTVESFAGSSAPTGWLLCHGQSLNATSNPQYADLWGVLGTTYGGSGITAFNLPDLRGRSVAGKDDMGGSAANRITNAASGITGTSLGANGGAQTHTMSSTEMPSHTHTQNAHTHRVYTSNRIDTNAIGFYYNSADGWGFGSPGGSGGSAYYVTRDRQDAGAQLIENSTPTNQNTGGGGAHQNMPPTIILNYIIKI